jgi:hypothetical protein
MLKFFFEFLTSPLGLPIDAIWEYVILAVIAAVAFCIGWVVSPGGEWGSAIHWVVRFVAFIVLWAIVYGIIAAVNWIVAHWVPLLCIAGGIALVACGIWVLINVGDMREERRRN